jgi:hypothetical protein
MSLRRELRKYTQAPITHQVAMDIVAAYNRPNDKISEMIRSGELIALRRGLYIPGPEMDLPTPDPYLIANHLRGPSYVSLETALAYWGMIPERVVEVSSITLKASRIFHTPIGRFSYRHGKAPYYSFGIVRVELAPQQFALMASREKALCDTIVYTSGVLLRSVSQTMDYLLDDMRIDEVTLRQLSTSTIQSWLKDAPKRGSIAMLINTLQRL